MWRGIRAVTDPSMAALSLEEARSHLRVDHSHEDADISAAVASAEKFIEGPNGVGIPLMSRQWAKTMDAFPACILIPLYPVISVDQIDYVDTDGVSQTLASTEYQVDLTSDPVRIEPGYGKSWPTTRRQLAAVTITFTAGYANLGDVPADLRHALKLLVGHFFAHREAEMSGSTINEISFGVRAILNRYARGMVA